MANFKYIYGPVPSWRLGRSLGVDVISQPTKKCSFDCIYCQINEPADYEVERRVYVDTAGIIKEIKELPDVKIDYITLSGKGEPTLAKNLGEVIDKIKEIRDEKIAVLTNSSLIDRADVREDLKKADFVAVKLDADCQQRLNMINRPADKIKFDSIIAGIKEFKKEFKGRLALQIMFVEANKIYVKDIVKLSKEIAPDEIELNTPTRPSGVKPLSEDEMRDIKLEFLSLEADVVSVYDKEKTEAEALDKQQTLKRRGLEK